MQSHLSSSFLTVTEVEGNSDVLKEQKQTKRRKIGAVVLPHTQLYVNMEKVFFGESTEEYTVKIASTVEACKLLEVGFEFVTNSMAKNCSGSKSKMTKVYTTVGNHQQLFIKITQCNS